MAKKNRNIPQMRGPVQPKFPVPKYTEEEQMTIDKANSIIAEEKERKEKSEAEAAEIISQANTEKEKILSEAVSENERLIAENNDLRSEIERLTAEKAQILADYADQKESLRLNSECQEILDGAEKTRADAQAESDRIITEAKNKADEIEKSAVTNAEQTTASARTEADEILSSSIQEADGIVSSAKQESDKLIADAKKAASDELEKRRQEVSEEAATILATAREEEQRIISGKEAAAELAAESVRKSADDYASRTRTSADEYMVRVKEQADKSALSIEQAAEEKAAKILANTQEIIDSQKASLQKQRDELHNKEKEFSTKQAEAPAEIQRLADEKTEALRVSLQAERDKVAQKDGELRNQADALKWEKESFEEEKRQFGQRVDESVSQRHSALLGELNAAKENERNLTATNLDLNKRLRELADRYMRLKGADVAQMQSEIDEMRASLRVFSELGITTENAQIVANAQKTVAELRKQITKMGTALTEAKNSEALMAGNEEKLAVAERSSATYQRMVEDLVRKLDERKSVSRSQMLLPIQEPPKFFLSQRATRDPDDYQEEEAWLKNILDQSAKSGIILSERFLYAYHTSLKIGEWSPMVVLAGVSGTGKSELPKQYAHHGGMHFLSVPVKPDWDSPASLFGYFNAIENRFEATELLRALYQMQEEYKDDMFLVLLDEMNLAHPEQYFADLLSKFEENRGSDKPAEYDILLGAGEAPEKLSIARNVLWTGTMNEDETTKGLSDKVVDRCMLITFPCPKELHDRDNTRIQEPKLTLSRGQWTKWQAAALERTASDGLKILLAEKKGIIQQINGQMSSMGRNLGHRVWQSIENYILNYPTVISTDGSKEEVEKAFCDAVAFKMMPKLRGLETRGRNEDYLSAIRNLLPEQLQTDFSKACDQTSEVFRWNSADFMEG